MLNKIINYENHQNNIQKSSDFPLLSLPKDLLLDICSYLDLPDLLQMPYLNKAGRTILQDKRFQQLVLKFDKNNFKGNFSGSPPVY
jgi:hypothetical protein